MPKAKKKNMVSLARDFHLNSSISVFVVPPMILGAGIVDQATASPIGPNEVPPTFSQAPSGGVPMVTCRVCAAMIDISSKKEQHVVKCHQCQEATVNIPPFVVSDIVIFVLCAIRHIL